MVVCCAASGCKNKWTRRPPGVSFHRFPLGEELCGLWERAVDRPDWKPSNHQALCSAHFEESCLDRTGQTNRLRENSVPTLLMDVPAKVRNKRVPKVPAKKRRRESDDLEPQCSLPPEVQRENATTGGRKIPSILRTSKAAASAPHDDPGGSTRPSPPAQMVVVLTRCDADGVGSATPSSGPPTDDPSILGLPYDVEPVVVVKEEVEEYDATYLETFEVADREPGDGGSPGAGSVASVDYEDSSSERSSPSHGETVASFRSPLEDAAPIVKKRVVSLIASSTSIETPQTVQLKRKLFTLQQRAQASSKKIKSLKQIVRRLTKRCSHLEDIVKALYDERLAFENVAYD